MIAKEYHNYSSISVFLSFLLHHNKVCSGFALLIVNTEKGMTEQTHTFHHENLGCHLQHIPSIQLWGLKCIPMHFSLTD